MVYFKNHILQVLKLLSFSEFGYFNLHFYTYILEAVDLFLQSSYLEFWLGLY